MRYRRESRGDQSHAKHSFAFVCYGPAMTAPGQNEPCHSLRRHGRSTSVSGPAGPGVGASESGQFRTLALVAPTRVGATSIRRVARQLPDQPPRDLRGAGVREFNKSHQERGDGGPRLACACGFTSPGRPGAPAPAPCTGTACRRPARPRRSAAAATCEAKGPLNCFSRNEGQTARLYRQQLLPQAPTDDCQQANDSRAGSHVEDACAGRLRARRV